MNCAQVEKLLPLYADHDLNEERERLINAHLQSCPQCTAAASEYRESRQWLQEFAPPVFGNDVYAEIRKNVWRQIEAESSSLPLSESVARWFRGPRLVWAFAIALLIVVSAVGLYLFENRRLVRQQVIATDSKTSAGPTAQGDAAFGVDKLASGTSSAGPRPDKRRSDIRQHERKRDRKVGSDRIKSFAVNSTTTQSVEIETPSQVAVPAEADVAARNSEKVFRMEIQTKNPNIRIIWFARRDAKAEFSNSRGI